MKRSYLAAIGCGFAVAVGVATLPLISKAEATTALRGSERSDGYTTPSIRDEVREVARERDMTFRDERDQMRENATARITHQDAGLDSRVVNPDDSRAVGGNQFGGVNATASVTLPPPPPPPPPPPVEPPPPPLVEAPSAYCYMAPKSAFVNRILNQDVLCSGPTKQWASYTLHCRRYTVGQVVSLSDNQCGPGGEGTYSCSHSGWSMISPPIQKHVC